MGVIGDKRTPRDNVCREWGAVLVYSMTTYARDGEIVLGSSHPTPGISDIFGGIVVLYCLNGEY